MKVISIYIYYSENFSYVNFYVIFWVKIYSVEEENKFGAE